MPQPGRTKLLSGRSNQTKSLRPDRPAGRPPREVTPANEVAIPATRRVVSRSSRAKYPRTNISYRHSADNQAGIGGRGGAGTDIEEGVVDRDAWHRQQHQFGKMLSNNLAFAGQLRPCDRQQQRESNRPAQHIQRDGDDGAGDSPPQYDVIRPEQRGKGQQDVRMNGRPARIWDMGTSGSIHQASRRDCRYHRR